MTLQEKLGGMTLFDAARAAGVKFIAEVLPASKFVQARGLRFHYLDWGQREAGGKPKMLLLHGGAQTAHMWDFFALALRDSYHIVALDQRGHGDSSWAEDGDYTTEAHTADIAAVTDAIAFDKFVLIGLSMGGRNSYSFTARHPQKVGALVIVDVGPEVAVKGSKRIQEFLQDSEVFESLDWLVERVKRYNPHRAEEQIRGSLANNLKQLPDGRWTWKHDRRRGIRRDRGGEITQQAWEDVKKIRCPTLIVRGAESDIFKPTTAKKMLAAIPGSKLTVVAKAGHLVPGDNPVEFEKAVREFLKGL